MVHMMIERLRKLGSVGYRRRQRIHDHLSSTHISGHTGIHGIMWRMVPTQDRYCRYEPDAIVGHNHHDTTIWQWVIPIFPRVRRHALGEDDAV